MREDGEALDNCLDALQYLVDHQVPYLAREFSELVDPEGEFELEDDSEEAFVAFVRSCEARYGIPIDLANGICRYWM